MWISIKKSKDLKTASFKICSVGNNQGLWKIALSYSSEKPFQVIENILFWNFYVLCCLLSWRFTFLVFSESFSLFFHFIPSTKFLSISSLSALSFIENLNIFPFYLSKEHFQLFSLYREIVTASLNLFSSADKDKIEQEIKRTESRESDCHNIKYCELSGTKKRWRSAKQNKDY